MLSPLISVLIFVFLLFLFAASAFWSAAETALASLSKYRIKKLIALNKILAGPLSQWLKSPYYILTTVLVGNTVNDLVLSYMATILAINMLLSVSGGLKREVLEFFVWLLVTFLLLIIGEIAPKIYGRRNPEKVTLSVLPVLARLVALFRPVFDPLIACARKFFPKLNIMPFSKFNFLSIEEIRGLIKQTDTTKALGNEASTMLDRALLLGDMAVAVIMTPLEKIESVKADLPEERFIDLVVETGRSRIPVYKGTPDKIIGFIHSKDMLAECRLNKKGSCIDELLRPPYFITAEKKVYDLLNDFQTGKTHIAFVKDVFGVVCGMVTLEDVLEEIVGDILDEAELGRRNSGNTAVSKN
ncbi:MAG: hemolysin family protein [Endomicrobiales bacterium]|nr:hemolysin family protein [Endomicrobiales bacterium]